MDSARATASRHALARRGLALALVAAACLAGLIPTATAAARPLITGISGVDEYSPAIFRQARDTGAGLVRISISWAAIAPTVEPAQWQPENPADPNYDWSFLDQGVVEAVHAGLTPVLMVDGAPSWAQRCKTPAVLGNPICDLDPAALAAFATAAARRYSGQFGGLPQVRYWEGGNEPNLSLFFFPQFNTAGQALSPGLYRKLANSFYAAVKSVDPANLVIAGGLGPIAIPKWTVGPMRFTRLLLCMTGGRHPHRTRGSCEGGVHFDIFDIHPYTTGGPTHQGGANDVELGDLPKLQKLLQAADRAGRIKGRFRHTQLWSTEFSWDSKPPDPGGLAMRTETRWTAEALYRAWRAGVSRFFWYSLEDKQREPGESFSESLESGLFFRAPTPGTGRPKRVLFAFRFPFVAFPRHQGLVVWGRTPDSRGGRVAIQAQEGGHWRRVLAIPAAKTGIFQGTAHIDYGHDRRGAVRAVYRRRASVPFSMHPVEDFYQPPFG